MQELQRCYEIAHEKNDLAGASNLSNKIGNSFFQSGDYNEALFWHRKEQSHCEDLGNVLGSAIAYSRVGQCMCEKGNYVEAVRYHGMHLTISREKSHLLEEQQAFYNLGRTYFIYSQSELNAKQEKEVVDNFISLSLENYLSSLKVCEKLQDCPTISGSELAEMKSQLYLNLGNLYQFKNDQLRAKNYIEQALAITKETETVYQCYSELGSFHQKNGHRFIALQYFHDALIAARKLSQKEVDTLNVKIAQVHFGLSQFEECITYLRKVKDRVCEALEQDVHQILKLSLEVKKVNAEKGIDDAHKKAGLLEKLGDSCCKLKAYPPALKFYGEQLWLAENWNFEPKDLSLIYVSLASTHTDCKQYSLALHYYSKELQLQSGNAKEECDTWYNIAKLRESAGHEEEEVVKAYTKAAFFAEKAEDPERIPNVFNNLIKYLKAHKNSAESSWQQKLDNILQLHPNLANEADSNDSNDDDEELSQIFSSTDDEYKENDEANTRKRMRSREKIKPKDGSSASPGLHGSGNKVHTRNHSSKSDFRKRNTKMPRPMIESDSSSDETASDSELRLQPKKSRCNEEHKRKRPPRKLPKKRRFSRCTGKQKYLCKVCSKKDCGKCVNCLNRSKTHQSCSQKPKKDCRSWKRKQLKDRKAS